MTRAKSTTSSPMTRPRATHHGPRFSPSTCADDSVVMLIVGLQTFSKYLSFNRSSSELLLFILKQLVKEQMHYEAARGKGTDAASIAIAESDFIEKVGVR